MRSGRKIVDKIDELYRRDNDSKGDARDNKDAAVKGLNGTIFRVTSIRDSKSKFAPRSFDDRRDLPATFSFFRLSPSYN